MDRALHPRGRNLRLLDLAVRRHELLAEIRDHGGYTRLRGSQHLDIGIANATLCRPWASWGHE